MNYKTTIGERISAFYISKKYDNREKKRREMRREKLILENGIRMHELNIQMIEERLNKDV